MAEDFDFESRTEAPTQRRRDEARAQGRVAVSPELTTSAVLLAGIAALAATAHGLATGLLGRVRSGLTRPVPFDLGTDEARGLLGATFTDGIQITGVVLGVVFAAALAASVAQVGLRVTPDLLTLNWGRLSPLQAEGRLLSWARLSRVLLMLVKLAVVGFVCWWLLRGRAGEIMQLHTLGLGAWLARSWGTVIRLALGVGGAFALLGVADYAYQRWRFERSLRMTRQELKEELKRDEGDPQIKARVRKLQREAAQKKMMRQVPGATVVITNPTHLAVALKYEGGAMAAPRVVAKGAGFVARRIAELARRHGVPVVEKKTLARALFAQVKVNQEIPAGLYLVVAELLAYVYRLKGVTPPDRPPG